MAVEDLGQPISNLNPLWPRDDDLINEGAAHIRVVKDNLQFQFPNLDAAVNSTPSEMNALAGADETNPLQAQIDALVAAGNRITGEIRGYGGASAPADGRWLICDGSALDKGVYADLFAVLGTAYGSDATNFNLPDLRGRSPIGVGTDGAVDTINRGQKVGASDVTLTAAQSGLPAHSHLINMKTGGDAIAELDRNDPIMGATSDKGTIEAGTTLDILNNSAANASSAHENQSPAQGVNFIIAMSEADYNRANP